MATAAEIPLPTRAPSPLAQVAPALLSDALEALSEGFALFDGDGRLVACNGGFHALHPRCSPLFTPGMSWHVLLHEAETRGDITADVARRMRIAEERLLAGSGPESFEFAEPGGRFLAAALSPTAQGGIVMTLRDVTARHRLEADEREADLILRKVLEACPANVVMCRLGDGQVLYRSPAATELLGAARTSAEYFASRVERADFITALLPDGRVEDFEFTCLRADGARFPASISARLIDYRDEDVMVTSILDLSHEIEMQRKLAEQREQIFQAEKMSALGELLAGVAHELNNPLSVVVGHALMLHDEDIAPETLRRVEKISEAAERCARIVKSFLAMARQQPARLVPIDLAETIAMAVDALENGAEGLGTRIETDIAPDLPPVRGDAHQIAQVVINLVANADQAIRDSHRGDLIRLSARHDASADTVRIEVADNGPGIPDAIRRRVFDPLFTTKPVGSGTGIGLALCHRIVSAHGGRIEVLPDRGTGATVVVWLPTTTGAGGGEAVEPVAPAPATRGRILVVDDEAEVADLIREILVRDGFEVETAASGEAALDLLAARHFTLVLTDFNMPGMGGRGFYERLLRERPALARRVAFVTGDTMSPQARGFLDGAGLPCLEKPIAPAELRRLVQAMLDPDGRSTGT